MKASSRITYFGWSSFVIDAHGSKLAFDPICRKLFGGSWAAPSDYRDLAVVCITHGHYDHFIDVPSILKNSQAVAVSSPRVCSFLEQKYGVPKDRLRPVVPGEQITLGAFAISTFSWGHREISYRRFFKEGLFRAQILPTLQFAWLNFLWSPHTAPFYGYVVTPEGGPKVMNYCEGFNDTMDLSAVQSLGKRYQPEVVLAGAQLTFQEYLARGLEVLSPKKTFVFHPHEPMFSKLGLVMAPTEDFATKAREIYPDMEVVVANPLRSYVLD